jgi:hypothetical protein
MSDCVICGWVMVGSCMIVGGIRVTEAHARIDYAAGKGRRPRIAHNPASRANLCGNDEPASLSHELHPK